MRQKQKNNIEPVRKLSPWRVLLALTLVALMAFGSYVGQRHFYEERNAANKEPWFASYVDVTVLPRFAFEELGTSSANRNAVLSFIVASATDSCTPSWGGAYDFDQAAVNLDLDRRIARLRQQDGNIAISFGGLKNDELALACNDVDALSQAYGSVIERYDIDTIDLDLEGRGLTDLEAAKRRATALSKLQIERQKNGKSLAIWLTIPVSPQGLTKDGTNAVATMLNGNVDLAGINIMTMNYGASRDESQNMHEASKNAVIETKRQIDILYRQSGFNLSDTTLWKKIGATPMIGQNDESEEIFTLEDAQAFNGIARDLGMGRISMWSANRDRACGGNYIDLRVASDSCSGIEQYSEEFATLLSAGFDGSMTQNAGVITVDESAGINLKDDDPATSPYQIWSPSGRYLQGTKVVWHQNVYEAKWWTQGDTPDNPVLQTWETPWKLIGPVLPGEKPIEQPTLPKGTYPEWKGTEIYEEAQRVLFDGIPYQAKWWTRGDSPAAASSNPDSSPWVPLTQAQIEALLSE